MTTPILEITELVSGQVDQFATANEALRALESATQDILSVDMSSGNVTLTAEQFQDYMVYNCTGHTTNDRDLTLASSQKRFFAVLNNGTTGDVTVILGSPGIVVSAGAMKLFYTDGTSLWSAS